MPCRIGCSLVSIHIRALHIKVTHRSENGFFNVSIGVEKVQYGIMFREFREEDAEESKETIEGAALDAHETFGADHVRLKLFGWREYSVVPDGIENDVGNRVISWTKAVASLEEALVMAYAQGIPRKQCNCFEVQQMDFL